MDRERGRAGQGYHLLTVTELVPASGSTGVVVPDAPDACRMILLCDSMIAPDGIGGQPWEQTRRRVFSRPRLFRFVT